MRMNWRTHKFVSFAVMALIACGLLGLFGINLNETALFIPWKYVLVLGVGYLAWVFQEMLHF